MIMYYWHVAVIVMFVFERQINHRWVNNVLLLFALGYANKKVLYYTVRINNCWFVGCRHMWWQLYLEWAYEWICKEFFLDFNFLVTQLVSVQYWWIGSRGLITHHSTSNPLNVVIFVTRHPTNLTNSRQLNIVLLLFGSGCRNKISVALVCDNIYCHNSQNITNPSNFKCSSCVLCYIQDIHPLWPTLDN